MKHLLTCAALLAAPALPAFPQSAEFGISAGYGSLGENDIAVNEIHVSATEIPGAGRHTIYSISNGVRIGGRMGFYPGRFLGHEASYAYQHSGLDFESTGPDGTQDADLGAIRSHHFYYNALLHAAPAGFPIRPFVTGGGGFSAFFLPRIPSFSGYGSTKFGYNYGGGIKLNFYQYGIRFDVRNHVTGKPFGNYLPNVQGKLNNTEFSVTFYVLVG